MLRRNTRLFANAMFTKGRLLQQPYCPPLGSPRDLSTDKKVTLHLASLPWDLGVQLLAVRGELPAKP